MTHSIKNETENQQIVENTLETQRSRGHISEKVPGYCPYPDWSVEGRPTPF